MTDSYIVFYDIYQTSDRSLLIAIRDAYLMEYEKCLVVSKFFYENDVKFLAEDAVDMIVVCMRYLNLWSTL